jgi:serine/threonine protein phosphatase PrpC
MSVVTIPDAVAIDFACQCDCGKVREETQDMVRHTVTRIGDLLVVAEGIGGSEASRMAVETISASVEGMPAFFPPEIAVEEAVCHANAAIASAAAEANRPHGRIGATVVVALLRACAEHAASPVEAIIGHVGDSRAYLLHNQKLMLLTRGRTAAQNLPEGKQVTAQAAGTEPDRSTPVRYLGRDLNVRVEMRGAPLDPGDTLLLCSDGLWRYVSEQEIERILSDGALGAEEASRALLNLALDAGGQDNVAIEIARIHQGSEAATAASATEARSEARPAMNPMRGIASASDTTQPAWRTAPLILENGSSATEPPSPKKKTVLNLIRGLGKRIGEKDAITEKPAIAEADPPSNSGDQTTVSWATPEPIVYGTRLSSTQLNAIASVQGRFLYTPGPGYVLPAGMHTLWVTFYPADSPEGNPLLASVSISVTRATPSIQWPAPSHVPPGAALGPAQLNATASVAGVFEYSPAAGEVLPEGTHTLSVTFNPGDQANYAAAQATMSVTVAKTVAAIDWAPPASIPFGTPLADSQLNASASVPGTFVYSPAHGEVLSAGAHTLSVTFTPGDGASYAPAQASVTLSVTRARPAITWPAPERITYGAALNELQLNATASAPGTFVYKPGLGAVLAAGEHTPSVVFTPSNLSDYTPAQAVIRLSVSKATPAISWPAPDPIHSGTPLGSAQLNASASVPGRFAYKPAAGERLGPGTHTLSVTFTPADGVNYTPAQASVPVTVNEILPAAITWASPAAISYGTALGAEQLNAVSSVPGSFLYIPAAGDVLPPGQYTLSVIFTPEDQERYAKAHAAVILIVQGLPDVDRLLMEVSETTLPSGSNARPARASATEQGIVGVVDRPIQRVQRETRIYKGAIYEKGDDGLWHLQRR